MSIDNYLYEIIEEYKSAEFEEEKEEIFKDFCKSIWGCKNRRRVFIKTIRYKVKNNLKNTEIGKIFEAWSEVEYKGYKALVKKDDVDWCSVMRQKINNLYTKYFDEDVILNKDYMSLLRTPQNLYYQWINGVEMNAEELTDTIDNAIHKATELKKMYAKQKINLTWSEYKILIEGFLRKAFDNCKLLDEYEGDAIPVRTFDFFIEDQFYIKYFCKSLDGEMLKWQKKYYGVRDHQKYKRCKECGKMIENTGNKKMFCIECATKREQERKKKIAYKYRKNNVAK